MSPITVLNAEAVDLAVLSIDVEQLVLLMRTVFETLSTTDSTDNTIASPLRSSICTPTQTLLFMPSRIATAGGTGIKVVSVPTGGGVDGLPGTTMIMNEVTGKLDAVLNARQLTALRNAAGS